MERLFGRVKRTRAPKPDCEVGCVPVSTTGAILGRTSVRNGAKGLEGLLPIGPVSAEPAVAVASAAEPIGPLGYAKWEPASRVQQGKSNSKVNARIKWIVYLGLLALA